MNADNYIKNKYKRNCPADILSAARQGYIAGVRAKHTKLRHQLAIEKAKVDELIEIASRIDDYASHSCWPLTPEGCTCGLLEARKQLQQHVEKMGER